MLSIGLLEAQLPLLRHLVQEAQETSSHKKNVREIVRVSNAEKVAFSSVLTAVLKAFLGDAS